MPRIRLRKPTSAKQELINNTPKLIRLLESKRLLWDTTDPNFYNLPERAENWRNLTRAMFANYDECDEEDQQQMISQIKTRWRHVRTAYVRHKKVPNLKKSNYVYDKEMAFYSSQGRSAYSSFHGGKKEQYSRKLPKIEKTESNNDELTDTELEHNESFRRRRIERKSRVKSSKIETSSQNTSMDDIFHEILIQESDASNTEDDGFSYMYEYGGEEGENLNGSNGSPNDNEELKLETSQDGVQSAMTIVNEDIVESDQNKQSAKNAMVEAHEPDQEIDSVRPRSSKKTTLIKKSSRNLKKTDIDDDQCFFDSLKPALRNLNEDDKMDFRIEVMSILRDLKRK